MFLLPEFITSLLRSTKKIYLAREYYRKRRDMEFGEESRAGWYCLKQKDSRCWSDLKFYTVGSETCHTTGNTSIFGENVEKS